mgnify:CR=1 FL=1
MLKKLIKSFEGRTDLPIEVEEIATAIISEGLQDEIHFVPVEADPNRIHGAVGRFRYRPRPYADPIWVAHIPFNSRDSLEMQRVTCCKELIHLFDSDLERTDTEEEVPAFIARLLGPFSSDDLGLADLMAGKDKLAVYMCLPLLLPKAALRFLRQEVKAGRLTSTEAAEIACMPLDLVVLMLDENWDSVNGALEAL